MPTYNAPLEDMRFVLNEVFDYSGTIATLPGYEEATGDLVDAVLEEAAKLCENDCELPNHPPETSRLNQ